MKKNNSYLDDFEGIIIRNDYLSRSTFEENSYREFKHLCKITASEMFFKYDSFYRRISYHQDDVEQLCNCYLVSYLSLYSFEKNKKVCDRFVERYTKKNGVPPSPEFLKKEERNRIVKFLRQQCQNSILVVNRKSRNIVSNKDIIAYFAYTKNSIPIKDLSILIENSEKFNYRKLSLKEYKMLQNKQEKKRDIVDDEGYRVIVVQILASGEEYMEDMVHIKDDKYSPETVLNRIDTEMEMAGFTSEFKKEKNKVSKLKSFIETHKKDKSYKEEINAARAILKEIQQES